MASRKILVLRVVDERGTRFFELRMHLTAVTLMLATITSAVGAAYALARHVDLFH